MRKLISNKNAKRIKEKHTQEEIDNGILTLVKVEGTFDMYDLLEQKLLEEVNEILSAKRYTRNYFLEIDDLIEVCKALQGKSEKFSDGWVLGNSK